MLKNIIVNAEINNPHVNWIISFSIIGIAIGFLFFVGLLVCGAYIPSFIVLGIFTVAGFLAGIRPQLGKKKRKAQLQQ